MRWPLPWPKSWRRQDREVTPPPPEPGEAEMAEVEGPPSFRKSAILFARDILLAFLVVGLVLGILFAYTQVWPPMVVVESRSMQHSDRESFIGVIDTGDLVLVQDVHVPSDVVTWIEGRASGHRTYSDFGDVIIFLRPNQAPGTTPVIHRAYAFIMKNATEGADVPSLEGLPPGTWHALSAANNTRGPYASGISEFTLQDADWRGNRDLTFKAADLLAQAGPNVTSGFLTKGDNNLGVDPYGAIETDRILGKARGELPWFGLIKLTFGRGASGCCCSWGDTTPDCGAPKNSWDALLISLVLIIAGPFILDYGLGLYKERRKERHKRDATATGTVDQPPPPLEPDEPGGAEVPTPDGFAPAPPDTELRDEPQTESSEPEDDAL